MATQLKKLHPALKHAGYAATSVLPGEDAAEFEKLHRDLIAELERISAGLNRDSPASLDS